MKPLNSGALFSGRRKIMADEIDLANARAEADTERAIAEELRKWIIRIKRNNFADTMDEMYSRADELTGGES